MTIPKLHTVREPSPKHRTLSSSSCRESGRGSGKAETRVSPQLILLKLGSLELKSSLDSQCGITVIVKCNVYLGKISNAILKPFEAFT